MARLAQLQPWHRDFLELFFGMVAQLNTINHGTRCQGSRFAPSPVSAARRQKKQFRCTAQAVAAPATGTYSGKEIAKPLKGDHFLHIDDYSKEVQTCHARPCTETNEWVFFRLYAAFGHLHSSQHNLCHCLSFHGKQMQDV